jgi:hypothetical protein
MGHTHTWWWTVMVPHWHWHVIMHYVNIERVLWVSLHSNILADWRRYIHQGVSELVIAATRLDLNEDAEIWRLQ